MDKIKLVAILRGIRPAEAAEHIATLVGAGFRLIHRTGGRAFRRWSRALANRR